MDLGKANNTITLVAASLAAVFSTYTTFRYGPALKNLEVQQAEIGTLVGRQNLDHEGKRFDRDFKFSIIDRVFNAIGSGKPEQITVALAMVNTMLGDDPNTQKELLKAISNTAEASKEDQEQAAANVQKLNRFDSAQVAVAATPVLVPVAERKLRYDVFFGEGREQLTAPKAELVAKLLNESVPNTEVRVRPLPDLVNAREDYGLKRNELRYDPSEADRAKSMQAELAKKGIDVELHEKSGAFPAGYIGLFLVE